MAFSTQAPYLFAPATWYPAPLYVPYSVRIIWSILAHLIICGFSKVDCQENKLELRKFLVAHFLHNAFRKINQSFSLRFDAWNRKLDFKKHFPLHKENIAHKTYL